MKILENAVSRRVGLGLGRVADTLDAHKAKNGDIEIDMDETELNFCGSPMCFAGLFAVATTREEDATISEYDLEYKNYDYGADLIAEECGFKGSNAVGYWVDGEKEYWVASASKLKRWANDNPELWGNENAKSIFSGKSAFGIAEDDTLTLDILIAHLRGVSARCAELKA